MTKYAKPHTFFDAVIGLECAYSWIGRPWMSVHCYLLDDLLIDTAQRNVSGLVRRFFSERRITRIVLTHHHEDHSGNAGELADMHGCRVYAHHACIEKLRQGFRIMPYQHLVWGKALPVPASCHPSKVETSFGVLRAIHTPGHSKDHLVWFLEQRGWLFSGDAYLGDRLKYFRSDEKIDEHIASLKKLMKLDFEVLFCAHHPRLTHGKRHLKRKLQFLEDFFGKVKQLIEKGFTNTAIMRELHLSEQTFVKAYTCGNVSTENMIRSVRSVSENS